MAGVSCVCQKRGTKRRVKSRGNGSMGVASERAVSIPQITYDHIDDAVEKKDASFFLEQPRGSVEGNPVKGPHCSHVSIMCSDSYRLISNRCSLTYFICSLWRPLSPTGFSSSISQTSQPAKITHERSKPRFITAQSDWLHFGCLHNRGFIQNLTPQNAMFCGGVSEEGVSLLNCIGYVASISLPFLIQFQASWQRSQGHVEHTRRTELLQ